MIKQKLIILLLILVTFYCTKNKPSQNDPFSDNNSANIFQKDFNIVRYILDINGHNETYVHSACNYNDSARITGLFLDDITNLTDSLVSLEKLHELYIHNHNIDLDSLPNNIGELKNLGKISIFYAGLNYLPASIGNLTDLYWLSLQGHELDSLPNEICQLEKLELLNLGINNIVKLPENIGRIKSLKRLDVWSNKLIELPKSLGDLDSLLEIAVFGNSITTIPSEIGNLDTLQLFNLANNKLSVLPNEITKLRIADLRTGGNQICSANDTIKNWLNLYDPGWFSGQSCD